MPDQMLRPNPYSPYATATLSGRHVFPSFLGASPLPGVLGLAHCERMAVVPAEPLSGLDLDQPQPGLCQACVNAAIGLAAPARQEPQDCQECGSVGSQGRWCALCRQDLHDHWWAARGQRMKAVTIYQPWTWAIGRAATSPTGKTIENRHWNTRHRGLVAIHAGQQWDGSAADSPHMQAEWSEYIRTARDRKAAGAGIEAKAPEFVTGAITAVANLVDVHHSSTCARPGGELYPGGAYTCSPWAAGGEGGMYHWQLVNVRVLDEPVPCTGRQRFWDVPPAAMTLVLEQLGAAL
ncbi:hypothetical protein [Nonomuraea sp. NPDC003214]